jgi:tetratricopeptide (TPR) repeat protein
MRVMARFALVTVCLLGAIIARGAEGQQGRDTDPASAPPHERTWIDVAPAPVPSGLPLIGPDGFDALGRPRQVVDRAALRSLLVGRSFGRLNSVLQRLQDDFERDRRYEERVHDAFDALGYPNSRERELIDAWVAATPRSFAPYLARASHWSRTGHLWRGTRYARDTSAAEWMRMREAFDAARRDLATALRLRSGLVQARVLQLGVEITDGRRDQAEALMEEALRACPTCFYPRVEWLRALEPRWGGSLEEMEAYAVDRADPKAPLHRLLRGYVDLERATQARLKSANEEAFAHLDAACSRGDHWQFLVARADAGTRPDGVNPYLPALEEANAAHPGLSEVLARRADAYYGAKRLEEAGQDLLYVLRANPTSFLGGRLHARVVWALDAMGWKEHQAGRQAGAARLYALAKALAPADEPLADRAALVGQASPGQAGQTPISGDHRPLLTVNVVDPEGRPVTGSRVDLVAGRGNWEQLDRLLNNQGQGRRTDASGTYQGPVEAGTVVVTASQPKGPRRGVASAVTVGVTGAAVRLVLAGPTRIRGRVVPGPGAAAGGVEVRAIPAGAEFTAEPRAFAAALAGPDGAFTLEPLDAGRYRITTRTVGDQGGYGPMVLGPELNGGTLDAVVRLEQERNFRGRVLVSQADGTVVPAERFTVFAPPFGEKTIEAADGRFSISYLRRYGRSSVIFTVKGYQEVVHVQSFLEPDTDTGDVVVGRTRRLRGRVEDARGYPLLGVSVAPAAGRVLDETDTEGRFDVAVQEGPITLRFVHPRWVQAKLELKGSEQDLEVRLAAGAAMKFRVVDTEGKPVPYVLLSATDGQRTVKCTSAPNGMCEMEGLEPGDFTVYSNPGVRLEPGGPSPPPLHLRIAATETVSMRFPWSGRKTRLALEADIGRGRMVRPTALVFPGTPVVEAALDARGRALLPHYVLPANGVLEHLPPGRYTVVPVDARRSYTCAQTLVTLVDGDDRKLSVQYPESGCR